MGVATQPMHLFVKARPEVTIDLALGVGRHAVYVNWTVNNGNLPIQKLYVKYMKVGSDLWQFHPTPGLQATSCVISGLQPATEYKIRVEVLNFYQFILKICEKNT